MTEIKDICQNGIYLLYLGNKLQYIGKSKCVYKRFIEHTGEFDFDKAIVFPVPDFTSYFKDYDLREIERKLIYLYCPPYNTQYSKGAYKDKSFSDKMDEIVEYYNEDPCEINGKPFQRFVESKPTNCYDINCVADWLIRKEYESQYEFDLWCNGRNDAD